MKQFDRLAALAHRQLYLPIRDFAFVGAMVAMTALSLTAVSEAANQAGVTAVVANDNAPAATDGQNHVVRPISPVRSPDSSDRQAT